MVRLQIGLAVCVCECIACPDMDLGRRVAALPATVKGVRLGDTVYNTDFLHRSTVALGTAGCTPDKSST